MYSRSCCRPITQLSCLQLDADDVLSDGDAFVLLACLWLNVCRMKLRMVAPSTLKHQDYICMSEQALRILCLKSKSIAACLTFPRTNAAESKRAMTCLPRLLL